jgi:uncharacterized protein (TIGR00730 family)
MNRIVTIFGSSHPREGDADYALAFEVGTQLAGAGFTVCNGGYGGIMEASARGAKSVGGTTIGITIKPAPPNPWIDKVMEMNTLVERLQKLILLGDAYVVLKGGTGTLLELAAVWEFTNKNLMDVKPILALGSFWQPVVETVKSQLIVEGSSAADAITLVDTPQQLVEVLRTRLA